MECESVQIGQVVVEGFSVILVGELPWDAWTKMQVSKSARPSAQFRPKKQVQSPHD